MTLVTRRLCEFDGTGVAFADVTYDDVMYDEASNTFADPTASMLVSSVTYRNLTSAVKHIDVAGTLYTIPASTQTTTINIPTGQRVRIDSVSSYQCW